MTSYMCDSTLPFLMVYVPAVSLKPSLSKRCVRSFNVLLYDNHSSRSCSMTLWYDITPMSRCLRHKSFWELLTLNGTQSCSQFLMRYMSSTIMLANFLASECWRYSSLTVKSVESAIACLVGGWRCKYKWGMNDKFSLLSSPGFLKVELTWDNQAIDA